MVKEVLALTLREPESSLAGRQMKDCDSPDEMLNVVKHCLGDKKTNTISSRISSIRSYLSWADKLVMTLEKDPDDFYKDKRWAHGSWPGRGEMFVALACSQISGTPDCHCPPQTFSVRLPR